MTVPIDDAIAWLETNLGAIDEIAAAYKESPEAGVVWPMLIVHDLSGSMQTRSHGLSFAFPNLAADIYVLRTNLSLAIEQLRSFRNPVLRVLNNNPTLGGTVDTIVWEGDGVTWALEPVKWEDGTETLRYRFMIPVKCKFS